ncbi:hypothetical protein [Comamonas thiooxydans]|uniref:hypothetical protein n=1 Tax=Comamonas thiooxydans TaxID=363952 RepID=UPI000B40FD1A|nr:hypothetical protein [Comamonas thiooxydans]
MTNTNASLKQKLDKQLAVVQQEHQLMSELIDHFDQIDVALVHIYPHGYCAKAQVGLAVNSGLIPFKKLFLELLRPVDTVLFTGGQHSDVVMPVTAVSRADRRLNNVLPVFPLFTKSPRGEGQTHHWWTNVDGTLVHITVDAAVLPAEDFQAIFEGWSVDRQTIRTSTGTLTYYEVCFEEPDEIPELPIVALNELRQAGVVTSNPYKASALSRYVTPILEIGWEWRTKGVSETQAKLDQWLRYVTFEHQALTEAENEAVRKATHDLVKRYLPLAVATDKLLEQCHDALEELFKKGLIAPSNRVVRYLEQFLLEKVGVFVPSIEIRGQRDGQLHVSLGAGSQLLMNPSERTLKVDPNITHQRLHDVPVTYAKCPVI